MGSFVNAASQMNKAKIARTLACKTSLSARVDAFCASAVGDGSGDSKEEVAGIDVASLLWNKMQKRIDHVEGKQVQIKSKTLAGTVFSKHVFGDIDADKPYDESQDFKLGSKRKMDVDSDDETEKPKKKNEKLKRRKRRQRQLMKMMM